MQKEIINNRIDMIIREKIFIIYHIFRTTFDVL